MKQEERQVTPHIILLGDSVFDNAAYVSPGDDVLTRLRSALPPGWRATLNARDGAVIDGVHAQASRLPGDATHLVVSAGGNDALASSGVLAASTSSVAAAVDMIARTRAEFADRYVRLLDDLRGRNLPVAICTIYDARYPDPQQRRIVNTALGVLNDVITREAAGRGIPLIDLRVLFDDDADFANAIEPSGRGGGKLSSAIIDVVAKHDFSVARSCIYARAT